MKILKKILYLILILMILFSGFVIICALNPALTNTVADALFSDEISGNLDGGETGTSASGGAGESSSENVEAGPVSVAILPGQNGNGADGSEEITQGQEEIGISQGISGRNGYTPIQEDGIEIAEEEADDLTRQLGYGETGDGLTFDPLFYPYYAMLDEKGQHLYRQIYANANSLNDAFAPVEEVHVDELTDIFAAVYNDHPELFFVETAYYCKYRRDGRCAEIDLMFNRTAGNLTEAKSVFEDRAEQIAGEARRFTSNYERERYVHDALVSQIIYQDGAEMGQSAYSGLVNGRTVCAGYARAFQYILQKLEIPCYYCTGFAGENHAWNIVMLDDGYYNVDVTWDDTGEGTYDYFNKSDADYTGTHVRREMSVNLPPCNGERYRNQEAGSGTVSNAEGEAGSMTDDGNGNISGSGNSVADVKRSLSDVGMSEEEVLYNLADYYADCYQQITENGTGTYTFVNVLDGKALFDEWLSNYQSEQYKAGYLEQAMKAAGASRCEMKLDAEELTGGRYLITHEVVLR